MAELANWTCALCNEPALNCDIDHIVPVDLGGGDEMSNLRVLCIGCHIVKTSQEARTRGKVRRIQESDGLTKKKMNRQEKWLAKKLEG